MAKPRDKEVKKIAATDERYKAIVEDQTELICRFLPDGTLTFVNHPYCRYFHKKENELVGLNFKTFLPKESQRLIDLHLSSFTPGNFVQNIEHKVISPNGDICWHEWTNRAFFDKDGKLTDFQSVGRDITKRKQIEENLQRSLRETENIKFALDQHCIVTITDQKGRIIYINDKFCEISKYSEKELVNQDQKIIDIEHHSTRFLKELWGTVLKGKVWKGEIKHNAKDGSYYWADTTVVPFLDEGKRPYQYVTIQTDITERKEAEIKLMESEKCYRQLTELASYGILVHDGEKVVFMNNAGLKLVGAFKLEEIYGKPIIEFIHARDRDIVKKRIQAVLFDGVKTPLEEMKIKKLDGGAIDVEAIAGPISFDSKNCVQVLLHDITKLKEADQKLYMKNIALYELVEQIEIAKNRVKQDVMVNVENILMPIINTVGSDGLSRKNLNLLKFYLEEMTSAYGRNITSKRFKLTQREIEICNLVRQGQPNKGIAKLLSLSIITVEKHRNNIRKKLGIAKRNVSLVDFLKRV